MNDFQKGKTSNNNPYMPFYDMFDDWELIESSFASQYGIRLEREYDMSWVEFFNLLTGLTHETPLGLVVGIRAEEDPDRLAGFNSDQIKIRSEYRRKIDNERIKNADEKEKRRVMVEFQKLIKNNFG